MPTAEATLFEFRNGFNVSKKIIVECATSGLEICGGMFNHFTVVHERTNMTVKQN